MIHWYITILSNNATTTIHASLSAWCGFLIFMTMYCFFSSSSYAITYSLIFLYLNNLLSLCVGCIFVCVIGICVIGCNWLLVWGNFEDFLVGDWLKLQNQI